MRIDNGKARFFGKMCVSSQEASLESPKLIIEWDRENLTLVRCSVCRAIFPTVERREPEANKRLVEIFFQKHVKTEHSEPSAMGKGA